MAEKKKKKPSFFTLKRWNSTSRVAEDNPDDISPQTPGPGVPKISYRQHAPSVSMRSTSLVQDQKPRKYSAGGIKDLLQCPMCLEVISDHKMLPCQHTFCKACLIAYIGDLSIVDCPECRTKIQIHENSNTEFVNSLPSNLYLDSLLQLTGITDTKASNLTPPPTPAVMEASNQSVELYAGGTRCSQCKTMCDNSGVTACEHCKLNFCGLCLGQHMDDMRNQIGSILTQLDSAANKLEHKIEHYNDRCERILDQIKIATDEKINAILEMKMSLLKETDELKKSGELSALALKTSLMEARDVAIKAMEQKENLNVQNRVSTFVNLHENALQLLSDVTKWDTEHFVFDKENFRLELDAATPLEAESDEPLPMLNKENNPLESEANLIVHYRSRNFIPHYVWRKTSRPCGVGISPWSSHLYICGMDSHCVLVVERTQAKIVTRLFCDQMLCPVNIAFMKSLGEIYVTDKWKHCVHVFSKDNEYLRSIGQKGSRLGMFRSPEGIATDNANLLLYIVDTGNDRVQILQPDGKIVDQIGVAIKPQVNQTSSVWEYQDMLCTELNAPTSVAVTNDRVIVLDSGNRRVKVYNKQDKNKIIEFGALGQRKGQFRQPEVLAVDPLGLILVGDSGNCRVQVFKQNGQLVRVFGGLGTEPGKFGWISGIHVTKQLDIIISDTKTHCVNFF